MHKKMNFSVKNLFSKCEHWELFRSRYYEEHVCKITFADRFFGIYHHCTKNEVFH